MLFISDPIPIQIVLHSYCQLTLLSPSGSSRNKAMLFTDIFQFSEQDDLSSDPISLIINHPPPRPHYHKVLEPFSCGFIIQILNQRKLLNEPFRRKEIWLCVLGKKQDIIAFDEECFVSTSQNGSLSENKVFHAHTHYYIHINIGRKYIFIYIENHIMDAA